MATTFPRTIKPKLCTYPAISGPLISTGQSGKVNTRGRAHIQQTWSETFGFKLDATGRAFLAQIKNYWRNGTELDVVHQDLSLLGLGENGASPTVNGGSQTGQSIITQAWGLTEAVLKAGDWIQFANINTAYELTADGTSDGSGDLTISVNPPVITGASPADNAAIVDTSNVLLRAKIIAPPNIPKTDAADYINGLTLIFGTTP